MKEVAAELDQLRKRGQDIPHDECCQDNISPRSESSYSCKSDCTEEDNQNLVSHD